MLGHADRIRPSVVLIPNPKLLWNLEQFLVKITDDIQVIALRRQGVPGFAGYERRHEVYACRAIHLLDGLIRHDLKGVPEVAEYTVVPEMWVPGPSFLG